jgi:glycosyltransferase involved in cell wall biosynthesis
MENGILVQPGNEDEIFEALNLLMNNPGLMDKLSQNAINVREIYGYRHIFDKYIKFITD